MEKTITAFLDAMNVGAAQAWKNLTLFPLLSPGCGPAKPTRSEAASNPA